MPNVSFPELPDEARLWVYVADRTLSEAEQAKLHDTLERFFSEWTSHGRSVTGQAQLVDDRLLLVGATVPGADISGCGIDASVNVIEETGTHLDVSWISPLQVVYRDEQGALQTASRPTFRQLAERGEVSSETPVLDLSVDTMAQLRRGEVEQPAGASWHARVFPLS